MRRVLSVFIAISMLASATPAEAVRTSSQGYGKAAAGSTSSSNAFAWGIGLTGLAVIGAVTGVVVATSSSDPSSFSH